MAERSDESNQSSEAVEGIVRYHPGDKTPATEPTASRPRLTVIRNAPYTEQSPTAARRHEDPRHVYPIVDAQPQSPSTPTSRRTRADMPPRPAGPPASSLRAVPGAAPWRAPTQTVDGPVSPAEVISEDIQPETPYESRRETNKRYAGVALAGLALVGVIGAGLWGVKHFSGTPHAKPQPIAEGALIPMPPVEKDTPEPIAPTPETTLQATLPLSGSEPTPTATTSVPLLAATPETSKLSATAQRVATTPRVTVSPSAAAPTPVATTPRPSASTSETSVASVPTSPDKTSLRLLSKSADTQYAKELDNQYEGVNDFLHADLSFLTIDKMRGYQQTVKDVYANPDAYSALNGNNQLQWLDANKLQTNQASGVSPAAALDSHSRNVLQHANQLFPAIGENISKLAYLNNDYSARLTERLKAGEDVSESPHSDAVLIGKTKVLNGLAVAPIASTYTNKDAETVNVIDWEALVPIDRTGRFIGVVVLEQVLNPKYVDTPTDTPTIAEDPSPTPSTTPDNPESTYYSNERPGRHGNNGHGHKRD